VSVIALAARLIVAAVLAIAATAKLADRDGSRRAAREFGVPESLAEPFSLLLPLAELAIAAALLPGASARAAAAAAAALFLAFAVAVAAVLIRGRRPDCHCFGRLHPTPVGRGTIGRNAALVAMAGLAAVAGPGKGVGEGLAGVDVTPVGVALTVVALVLGLEGWFGWQLFRQNGRLIERVQALEESTAVGGVHVRESAGLTVGEHAPGFVLDDLNGGRRALDDLLAGGLPVALVFSDPDCGACAGLVPQLEQIGEERAGSLEIALISRGTPADNRARLEGRRLDHILLQREREVFAAYGVHTVPSATIVDEHGRIAAPLASGNLAIEQLFAKSAEPVPSLERLRVAVG
jgi:uncharacterized membrane protein YphA (DoxX/SURF4 family)/peroxiredoxin